MPTICVSIILDAPNNPTLREVKKYVEDAVSSWCGQLFPGYTDPYPDDPPDPLWDVQNVKVVGIHRVPKGGKKCPD